MGALRVMTRVLLAALLLAVAVGAAGYVVQHAREDRVRDGAVAADSPGSPSSPTPTPGGTPSPDESPSDSPSESPSPTPLAPVLQPGDRGVQVRELQHRLFQLAWWPELTTGAFDRATRAAVTGFQGKRGFEQTGIVDQQTWRRLVRMTDEPTHDQLFNVLHPGPAIYASGDEGEEVRAVQARLAQIAWLFGDVTGVYDPATTEAVRGFQAKREIPVTGEIDQRTLDRLVAMTYQPSYEQMHNIRPEPGALDPRCTTGRALCVDKATNSMRWVVDGAVQATYDVRFGSDELPTREGTFSVYLKSRDHVSQLYDTSMPFAMFFSGGQAVHFSPDFAARGYSGASHGCVNVRDYEGIKALFDQVQVGDKVIVYWS